MLFVGYLCFAKTENALANSIFLVTNKCLRWLYHCLLIADSLQHLLIWSKVALIDYPFRVCLLLSSLKSSDTKVLLLGFIAPVIHNLLK